MKKESEPPVMYLSPHRCIRRGHLSIYIKMDLVIAPPHEPDAATGRGREDLLEIPQNPRPEAGEFDSAPRIVWTSSATSN